MTPEEFLSLSPSEMETMRVAVLARNGVEDLHADGAFDDTQSPCLNRLFRQEAYQVMYAMQHADEDTDDEFVDYLVEVGQDGHPDAEDDMRRQCLTGAVARAVEEFAREQDIDELIARELAEAAQLGVLDQAEAEGLVSSPLGVRLFFSLISAWEAPELSADYRARFGLT